MVLAGGTGMELIHLLTKYGHHNTGRNEQETITKFVSGTENVGNIPLILTISFRCLTVSEGERGITLRL